MIKTGFMNNKYFRTLLLAILLGIIALPATSQRLNHVQGEILVKMKPQVNVQHWVHKKQRLQGNITQMKLHKKISDPMNIYTLKFDWRNLNEYEILDAVRKDPEVEIAQFNHYVRLRSTVPDDPQFDQQWQYLNTGQNGGTAGADIDADLAWDVTTGGITAQGDTIVVCIIDGGFEINHEDLDDNVWYNYAEIPGNGIDDDNNGFTDDRRGWNTGLSNDDVTQGDDPSHGTAVAGIIGAKGNNSIGVAGVNWDVKLMLVSGGTGVESEVIAAYSYPLAARKRYNETNGKEGAFVVATNASWGVDGGLASSAPLWCAFYDTLGVHGILNVGATINGDYNVDDFGDLPTTCPSDYLIGVTNMDHNDQKVDFAGYGPTHVDLGAFGDGTWTATSGNGYAGFGGTSGATPHVAGTIGLLYSAPCSDFIALAKSDPGAAALKVKQYILDGVDANKSLDSITVTGGRLNVNNSILLLLEECAPCPRPSGLGTTGLTDTQVNLVWNSNSKSVIDTLRWRQVGSSDWRKVPGAVSPHTLKGLTACTQYEFQLISKCDTIISEYSIVYAFKTDGCCEAPSDLAFSDISDSTATATWRSILAAQSYNIRIRPIGTMTWATKNTTNVSFDLTGLEECIEYEVQIQTVCTNEQTGYSASKIFTTNGCGPCRDMTYCPAPTLNASEEWIESVNINTLNNNSGSDDGYGDFTGGEPASLAIDNSYSITLTPAWQSSIYFESFKVWIDFNQDGDFEDAGEEVFAVEDDTTAVSGMVSIPAGATLGLTRMRVAMLSEATPAPCISPSGAYGEMEDYCVNITEDTDSCDVPVNLETVSVTETTAELQWNTVAGATEYILRYRLENTSSWTEESVSDNNITLNNLENCTAYEVQVKSVCASTQGNYSESKTFMTECSTATNDLSTELDYLNIYPNPFNGQLTVSFAFQSSREQVMVELINYMGTVVQSEMKENIPAGRQELAFDGRYLADGIYFVRFKTLDGKYFARKVIKMNE